MNKLSASELIQNKDGSIYHLSLKPKDISDIIFTVGDPGRVHRVSQHFDDVDFEMNKREFITHTGRIGKNRYTVISTGMGVSNIEILMNELDLLANYDFAKGRYKKRKKALTIIRLGSSGAIQPSLPVGSVLLSEFAVGLDNLLSFYNYQEEGEEQEIKEIIENGLDGIGSVYVGSADKDLFNQFNSEEFQTGITLTCPGFYAPQGRELNIPIKDKKLIDKLSFIHHNQKWMTNIEMETSAYYAFGKLMGHKCLSVNAILANRSSGRFSKNPNKIIDRMIRMILEKL